MSPDFNPLTSELPRGFAPEQLPIVFALAQVRFPPIKSVVQDGYIASFQENVRQQYPEYAKKSGIRVTVAPNGPVAEEVFSGHRFTDARSRTFVALAEDFVAVTSPAYKKEDFLGRLDHVAMTTAECIKPAYVSRLGIRFICRLTDDDVDNIKSKVMPDFLPPALDHLQKNEPGTLSRAVYGTSEGFLFIASWGFVPPGGDIPELQEFKPDISRCSWIMDADCIYHPPAPGVFSAAEINTMATRMVDRICVFLTGVFSGKLV